jgi:hypothetical protein
MDDKELAFNRKDLDAFIQRNSAVSTLVPGVNHKIPDNSFLRPYEINQTFTKNRVS